VFPPAVLRRFPSEGQDPTGSPELLLVLRAASLWPMDESNRRSYARVVTERRAIQQCDLEILRRSLVEGALPSTEVVWMLEELQRPLTERSQIQAALDAIGARWTDIRELLNELHRLTRSRKRRWGSRPDAVRITDIPLRGRRHWDGARRRQSGGSAAGLAPAG